MSAPFEEKRTTADIYLALNKALSGLDGDEIGKLLEALRHLSRDDRRAVRTLLVQTVSALALSDGVPPDRLLQDLVEECEFDDPDGWAEFKAEIEVYDLSQLYLASVPEQEPVADAD